MKEARFDGVELTVVGVEDISDDRQKPLFPQTTGIDTFLISEMNLQTFLQLFRS